MCLTALLLNWEDLIFGLTNFLPSELNHISAFRDTLWTATHKHNLLLWSLEPINSHEVILLSFTQTCCSPKNKLCNPVSLGKDSGEGHRKHSCCVCNGQNFISNLILKVLVDVSLQDFLSCITSEASCSSAWLFVAAEPDWVSFNFPSLSV